MAEISGATRPRSQSELQNLPVCFVEAANTSLAEGSGDVHRRAVDFHGITYPAQAIRNDSPPRGDPLNLQAGPSINMCHITADTLTAAGGNVVYRG